MRDNSKMMMMSAVEAAAEVPTSSNPFLDLN